MAETPLFDGSHDYLVPHPDLVRWLSADGPLLMRTMALAMVNPGLFVIAITCWRDFMLTRADLAEFLALGQREQVRYIGIFDTPATVRLLRKLRIRRIESRSEVDRVRAWLVRMEGVLPKVLLHAPVVHWPYLVSLSRQPWLASIPYPTAMDMDPEGIGNMEYLEELLDGFLKASEALGWDDHARRRALAKVRCVEHLEHIMEDLQRGALRVPVNLQPDSFIWIPTSYRDFQKLSRLQRNCVDQYFHRAARGEIQVVAVGNHKELELTAELCAAEDGFWYPTQVLAHRNRLARPRDIGRLLRWLAGTQVKNNAEFSYRRNLVRMMAWASARVVEKQPRTAAEAHWLLIVDELTRLLEGWRGHGLGTQMLLPLGKSHSL